MSGTLRRYIRGKDLVAMRDVPAGKSYVYHFDHQGTTQCLTDYTTGAVTDTFAADAWGVQVKRTGTSINRQWYVGGLGYYENTDSNTHYVRARYLAKNRGAWIAADPIPVLPPYIYASKFSI